MHLFPFVRTAMVMLVVLVARPGDAAELLIFEEPGCPWCQQWHSVIGPIYPKTAEGKRAPLRQLQIHKPIPADLELSQRPHFSPTFILVENGREVGRIEGYPGEDFFWGLLGQLMNQLDKQKPSNGRPSS